MNVHYVSTLSKGRNVTKNSFDIVAKNCNNVEATFDFIEAAFDFVETIVELVAFDNVASTVLLCRCCWCVRALHVHTITQRQTLGRLHSYTALHIRKIHPHFCCGHMNEWYTLLILLHGRSVLVGFLTFKYHILSFSLEFLR